MRTNIEIDDKLMKQAMKASGAATKKATVEQALQMFVRIKSQEGIRKLFGKVDWDADYDHKAMRVDDKWNGSALTWSEDAALPQRTADGAKHTVRKKAA